MMPNFRGDERDLKMAAESCEIPIIGKERTKVGPCSKDSEPLMNDRNRELRRGTCDQGTGMTVYRFYYFRLTIAESGH